MIIEKFFDEDNKLEIKGNLYSIKMTKTSSDSFIHLNIFNEEKKIMYTCSIHEKTNDCLKIFEKKYKVKRSNYKDIYEKNLFEHIKESINKDIEYWLENDTTDNINLKKIVRPIEKLYWLNENVLQKVIDTDVINETLEEHITINYMLSKNKRDKKFLLKNLSKNEKTKYIPLVDIYQELEDNNLFENYEFGNLFNVLMKENYKSYSKMYLLESIGNNILNFNESQYEKKECYILKYCLIKSLNNDKNDIKKLFENIKNKEDLEEFLMLFENKSLLNLVYFQTNIESIDISNIENGEYIKFVEDNIYFFYQLMKVMILEYITISEDIKYSVIKNIEETLIFYFSNEDLNKVWNEMLKEEFIEEIMVSGNINNF